LPFTRNITPQVSGGKRNDKIMSNHSLPLDENATSGTNALIAPDLVQRGLARYRDGDTSEALADLTEAIRLDPTYAPAYLTRGTVQDDPALAIADYTAAIQHDPDYVQAYYNRGFLRGQQGDYAGAIEDFTRVLQLRPDHPQWAHIRLDLSEWRKKIG
jgi:tetratricopeptide (TPR) repeat protein